MMKELDVSTRTGTVLNGVLFSAKRADTVVIAITGVHGNFYTNPFYYNIGDTLSAGGIDFIYAQTRDAYGKKRVVNTKTAKTELLGSFNEDFKMALDDVAAYIDYAHVAGYKRIILAGHSLGANKVIYYLSQTADTRVAKFIFLSPANIKHLTSVVTSEQAELVRKYIALGRGDEQLPFDLFGWLPCVADTAYQWLYTDTLNNVHVEADRDFSQIHKIRHTGALIIGTFDRFTYGDPSGFLRNINAHMPLARENQLIFIERTGHTYQHKEQILADGILELVNTWCTDEPTKETKDALSYSKN